MPGEVVGNNQNQGTETNNGAADAWERMAQDVQSEQAVVDVVDKDEKVLAENVGTAKIMETPTMEAPAMGVPVVEEVGVESPVVEPVAESVTPGGATFDQDGYRRAVASAEAQMPKIEPEPVVTAGEDLIGIEGETQETGKAGSEELDAWMESIKGSPEEYWQKLSKERSERGVELGEMPDLAKVDQAIANFFDKGLIGVTGEARAVREAMAKKAILADIAKLKERGGELNDETMRNVFYGTQRMLEEMYRGNRELREDAQEVELSPDEEIAWHLKMDPRKAKMNVLLVMQQHTRRPDEGSDAYEQRLRNYAEDTPEHQKQLEDDKAYNAEHPEAAAEYAAQVLRNGQRDDLPEFTYLKWEDVQDEGVEGNVAATDGVEVAEVGQPVEREGRIKQLFEKVRGKLGFRKVVDKMMTKVAKAMIGAMAWAEGVLAEEEPEQQSAGEAVVAETAGAQVERETGRGERMRKLNIAKAEAERRMALAQERGDSAQVLRWAGLIVNLNAKAAVAEAEDEEALAA